MVDFSESMCMVQAALLTEPHERQEGDLASSDRYISSWGELQGTFVSRICFYFLVYLP